MTKEEFDKTEWASGMRADFDNGMFQAKNKEIVSIDFENRIISFITDAGMLGEARCEHVTLVR